MYAYSARKLGAGQAARLADGRESIARLLQHAGMVSVTMGR